jgi:hypothetical protein
MLVVVRRQSGVGESFSKEALVFEHEATQAFN